MPRNRYLDALRATAIIRVFLHHALWFGWLTVVFPSMPIMFALAGYLMARSLSRAGTGAGATVISRVRRLLPPLWALAVVAVPLMLAKGWNALDWSDLAYWVLPVANPPSSAWGGPFALALWYLRAYLWLVLLSPLLWWAFKRRPVLTLLVPFGAALLLYSRLLPLPEDHVGDVLWSTACWGTAWVLGFARHTGLLDRIRPAWCAVIAVALGGAALVWSARVSGDPLSLTDPLAEMLWGIPFVLVALRIRTNLEWLDRVPGASAAITVLNARAVTIYVWHLPMLFAAGALVSSLTATVAVGALFTVAAALATGWIEDLAARRRPVLIPLPTASRAQATVPRQRSAPSLAGTRT
jgi:peptidoglycan/LPS O-acetylase OafA/YrhL